MLGLKTTIKPTVVSCPPPNKVQWQSSNDGKTFNEINISKSHSLSPESPLLVIPYTTFDDMLYYRLRLWNELGDQFSNTLYLKVTGCKFSACRVIEYCSRVKLTFLLFVGLVFVTVIEILCALKSLFQIKNIYKSSIFEDNYSIASIVNLHYIHNQKEKKRKFYIVPTNFPI